MQYISAMISLFKILISLDFAHTVSPILLAWTNQDLRRIALSRPRQSIMVPAIFLIGSVAIFASAAFGLTSFDGHPFHITGKSPLLPLVMWLYFYLNTYHFGMQNFGLARLFFRGLPRRFSKAVFCGGTMLVLIAAPHVLSDSWLLILSTFIISGGHWLSEIALTVRVSNHRAVFFAAIFAIGPLALLCVPIRGVPISMTGAVLVLFGVRIGLGFVHFLYDRWVWRFSDPQIRELIAPQLFGRAVCERS
jgi:hypothetical protein